MDKHIEDSIFGSGYLLVPRGLILGELAHYSACTRELYLWFLAKANHTEARWGNKTIRRGQLVTSVPDMQKALYSRHGAGRTYYSVRQVETAKTNLRRMGLIRVDGIARGCIVTVLNYCEIQRSGNYRHKRKTNEGRSKGEMTSKEGKYSKNTNCSPASSGDTLEDFERKLLKAKKLQENSDDEEDRTAAA